MNTLKSLLATFFLFQVFTSDGQGFYLKPSISYGIALNKQEIKYDGSIASYVQTKNYAEEINDGNKRILYENVKKEKVPLGKGKVFSLELGYESKKYLYYTLALNYGMMDKFIASSFSEHSRIIYNTRQVYVRQYNTESKQIVSPIWYGIQPGIGIFKKYKNYKIFLGAQAFLGYCRIRVIETSQTENLLSNGSSSYSSIGRNYVLFGAFMYGGSLDFAFEKMTGKRTSIGIKTEYRSQVYAPTKRKSKSFDTYYHVLGSVVPDSRDKEGITKDISKDARRDYLFESFSIGLYWKLYLSSIKTATDSGNEN